ncbi:hypothetical protein [Sphingomonas sp.]|uniref:hypothetical protein n=1 Tax=Sphingomonas sp. TaxID=28214 RepID=UPI0035BC123D
MALSGFASGALVAAPVAAVLTWLAVSWQQHVDVRVERDTVAVRADRAAFNAGFERDWSAATGQVRAACDPDATAELTRLRKRAAELEAKLAGSSADLERERTELRNLMVEERK